MKYLFILTLLLTSCYREESEQVTVKRLESLEGKNDPSNPDYLDNNEPFSVETDDGVVFFKNEGEEDEESN